MGRLAAAVAVILLWSASPLHAQDTTFTVNTASASVHAGPSTASPVVGTAARGRTFDVTRELGSWVRVAWPSAPNGAGYLHVTWGTVSHGRTPGVPPPNTAASAAAPVSRSSGPAASSGSSASAQSGQSPVTGAAQQQSSSQAPTARPPASGVVLPSHLIGLGGTMGAGSNGYAASGRMFSSGSLGFQVEAGRATYTSPIAVGRLNMTRVGASVMYLLPDHLSDAVWVRPYVGAGAAYYRSSLGLSPGVTLTGDKDLGYHALGGAEFTFAGLPQAAVSLDVRHEWVPAPFAGFDPGGLGVGLSFHWYVK